MSSSKELALTVAEVALDKQAHSVEIVDVSGKVDYTSYLVICSGSSEGSKFSRFCPSEAILMVKHLKKAEQP